MEETPDQRESFVQLVLPFVTVPFRPLVIINTLQYPRHLMDRIPYIFIRTIIRGSFLISIAGPLYPRHSQAMPPNWHFSRRELRLFNVPPFLPPNREDHRARVRARLGTNTNTNTSAFPSSSSVPSVFGGGSGGTTLATSAFGQPSLLSVNIMLSTRSLGSCWPCAAFLQYVLCGILFRVSFSGERIPKAGPHRHTHSHRRSA
ncbi:hypothetical protein EV361DRAFT_663675 [Lentinula raphanica]|nr:hypothetical protein EV361DRAFT_663675 [Lentinula raphanica]